MRPLISVILPCYNAGKFLKFSLESILNQDYNNLDIICINDGSSDNTLKLLEAYQTADTRIRIINNIENKGLISSLNNALQYVTGEYFARVDADDYCEPNRFAKQIEFLQKNKQYDLISSGYYYFVEDEKKLEYNPPVGLTPKALQFISLFSTPLSHAAIVGKTRLIKESLYHYDNDFIHSEDFELFSRLAWTDVLLGNLRTPLYWVRANPDSVSVRYNSEQIQSHLKTTRRNLKTFLGINASLSDNTLKILCNRINMVISAADLKSALAFIDHCYILSKERFAYTRREEKEIEEYLNLHKLNIIVQSNKYGFIENNFSNLKFCVQSVALLRPGYMPFLGTKILNYIRFRIFPAKSKNKGPVKIKTQ